MSNCFAQQNSDSKIERYSKIEGSKIKIMGYLTLDYYGEFERTLEIFSLCMLVGDKVLLFLLRMSGLEMGCFGALFFAVPSTLPLF